MALIDMVFRLTDTPQTMIGAVRLDALISEQTSLANGVTQYAVEEGAPVSDHISTEAEKLTIEGVVTGASVSLFGASGRSKMIEAKEALRVINEQRQPLTIVTGLDVYPEFAMESCDISRSVDDGEQLHISISLTKIRKAKTKEADIPPGKVRQNAAGKAGQTKRPAGKITSRQQTAKTTPSPQAQQRAQRAVKSRPMRSDISNILGVGK
ncbi:hypothetical protein A7P96_05165 [Eikenella sp. NML03-A-027]|uniref:phage baseplate protein n=1 Tax=Eikenella sp. NML03-A-027 TaxID=1795828 RepID=UPI0007DF3969|nr:hypothetical protein [Eikenella sp. NML03-A-027]OAM31676.1 hypothetical protein A7P96_05165 [Eikenella sp. NML03-A-027]